VGTVWGSHLHISDGGLLLGNISHMNIENVAIQEKISIKKNI